MFMKPVSIIVALAENMGIGKDNKLLTHIPGDLPRFRKITTGHTVIMGKNTYLSLPRRPLENRRNIVISDNRNDLFEGCITVYSVAEALEKCDEHQENFVIGGASVYRQLLQFASRLYLTLMHKSFDADTFFPEISTEEWTEISREKPQLLEKHDFEFEYVVLQRKG
jgi:dihydrofolate reductase